MTLGYTPPPVTANIQVWAQNVVTYLQRTASRLAFRRGEARATEEGIILWDEANGYPVVSKNGEYRQIILADGAANFVRTTDVTAAAPDTAYVITYDAPSFAVGITQGTPASRIVFEEGGLFYLSFTAQLYSTSAASVSFYFWPRVNGVDADSGSSIKATLHNNGATTVVSRGEIFSLNSGDYLEVAWAVSNTSAYLIANSATAFSPSTPATTLAITRISA